MIHPKNVTLHDTIKFMEVNIRASPSWETLAQMCGTQDPALIDGLLAFRSLLTRIYADADVLQGKDDKAKFNSLYETMLLFYTCAVFGELAQQGDQPEIVIDKPALLSKYKRGSLSKKTKLLGHHGIVMQWLSATGDKSSQTRAAVLSTTFPQDANLMPAAKYLADTINAIEPIDTGKERPFLIFTMTYERPGIQLTLPIDAAERIIKQRKAYTQPIQDRIESFHCVQCPKKCKGKNLHNIDGVAFCSGRAEARRIYMEITTGQDWRSIEAIADTAFA